MNILGTNVDLISRKNVLDAIDQNIRSDRDSPLFIVNTGFHGLYVAARDVEYQKILNSADIFTPDGIAPIILARVLGLGRHERATGYDIMADYFELANKEAYSSYFYGDTDETLAALRTNLEKKYPGHKVVGTFSPPFGPKTDADYKAHIEAINSCEPDFLFVGLGLPKQERWIAEYRHLIKAKVILGIGACFSFHAGTVKRAPRIVGDLGFEWAWRFSQEPKKLWRRVMVEGPHFIFMCLRNWKAIKTANKTT